MIRLRILHETNPRKYFPALFELADAGQVQLVGAHRYSVAKEFLRAALRDRTPLAERLSNAAGDLAFRLKLPVVRGEVVVMGFAPWDPRLLIYRGLARRNRVIYHTSWHDWGLERTPRQPKPAAFKRWLRDRWLSFLAHPNVSTVAVTPVVAEAVQAEAGVGATVIPHAVPDVFFAAGTASAAGRAGREGPLRLLYVGELSEKKGLRLLLQMMPVLAGQGVSLTVVGNGPLSGEVEAATTGGAVAFLGPVRDREKLAGIMAEHDMLVLLSQRTETWEELFGIVVVEALAAGLAVLATTHVGPRGILAPVGGAGLFDQDDHAGIAAQITRLAGDRAALAELRDIQVPVAADYAIPRVRASWQTVIEQAAGGPHS
ncbi:glycosyltransferase family 4 protein [Oceanicola sp. S124]|uniref:glycosyltransferase family 4 protein n=1 Tax=Oceanicola sp. S124 TaxID=1042378 RepID=UPI00025599C5|nr:glycosyltransferase family 4 protein [Oceanicola sp. S124]